MDNTLENVSPTLTYEHSDTLAGLATSLCEVQKEIKSIGKDASGYGYKYSSVSDIMDYLLPILSEKGIAITQFGAGKNVIVTMLIDSKSGEYLKGVIETPDPSQLEMKGVNIAQKGGAVRTYYKRYAICEMVGLTSNDEDNDASSNGPKKASSTHSNKFNNVKEGSKAAPSKAATKPSSSTGFKRTSRTTKDL